MSKPHSLKSPTSLCASLMKISTIVSSSRAAQAASFSVSSSSATRRLVSTAACASVRFILAAFQIDAPFACDREPIKPVDPGTGDLVDTGQPQYKPDRRSIRQSPNALTVGAKVLGPPSIETCPPHSRTQGLPRRESNRRETHGTHETGIYSCRSKPGRRQPG